MARMMLFLPNNSSVRGSHLKNVKRRAFRFSPVLTPRDPLRNRGLSGQRGLFISAL